VSSYRGWKISYENLGSVGPGTLHVAKAMKKGEEITASIVTQSSSAPKEELASMLKAAIKRRGDS